MMKYRFIYFWIGLIALISCGKDEPESPDEPASPPEYESVSTEEIAEALSMLLPDSDICNEVYTAVRISVELGLDESYYFAEAFGKGEKITKSTDVTRYLQSKLSTLPEKDQVKALFLFVAKDEKYQSNYQIYWPYSANWNGEEFPTITFQSKGIKEDETENVGYRITKEGVEDVIVNETYAQNHPVWIINFNPIPYGEYPDFSVSNWVEEKSVEFPAKTERRIYVYSPSRIKNDNTNIGRPNYIGSRYMVDFDSDTLSIYLKEATFKPDKKVRGLFSGGCHFVYNMNLSDINDYDPYNDPFKNFSWGVPTELISIRFVFLRSEMQPRVTKILDSLLSWRWLCYEYSMPVGIIQEYGGNETMILEEYNISHQFNPPIQDAPYPGTRFNGTHFPGDILYRNEDEILYSGNYERDELSFDKEQLATPLKCQLGIVAGSSAASWVQY